MKIIFSYIFLSLAVPVCVGMSREEALAPYVEQIMESYASLPSDYQQAHIKNLESYLALFTTSNDQTWNKKWNSFIKNMGEEFTPCRAMVIETMVIAEAYQACYPSPESRISNIASILFSEIPTNAILFIHQDVFESILRIEQQASGLREDVIIINSGRILDASYTKILANRYPTLVGLDSSTLNTVFEEAKKQKDIGNREFENLQTINGKVIINGYDIVCSCSLLMAKEISKSNPSRSAVFLPAVREFWKPIQAWNRLKPNGIFCVWGEAQNTTRSDPSSKWIEFIDTVAPLNLPLQVRLSNALGKVVNAHAFICKANGNEAFSKELFYLCGQRMKSVRIVKGESITIDRSGKMVEQ